MAQGSYLCTSFMLECYTCAEMLWFRVEPLPPQGAAAADARTTWTSKSFYLFPDPTYLTNHLSVCINSLTDGSRTLTPITQDFASASSSTWMSAIEDRNSHQISNDSRLTTTFSDDHSLSPHHRLSNALQVALIVETTLPYSACLEQASMIYPTYRIAIAPIHTSINKIHKVIASRGRADRVRYSLP